MLNAASCFMLISICGDKIMRVNTHETVCCCRRRCTCIFNVLAKWTDRIFWNVDSIGFFLFGLCTRVRMRVCDRIHCGTTGQMSCDCYLHIIYFWHNLKLSKLIWLTQYHGSSFFLWVVSKMRIMCCDRSQLICSVVPQWVLFAPPIPTMTYIVISRTAVQQSLDGFNAWYDV